jgi:hypothetical protein
MNRSHDGDLCKESFESIPEDVRFGVGTLDNGLGIDSDYLGD